MSLNVLHLSTHDASGGASRAALWQHRGLLAEGLKSRMLVRKKSGLDEFVQSLVLPSDFISRSIRVLKRNLISFQKNREIHSKFRSDFAIDSSDLSPELLQKELSGIDLINIQYCDGFLAIHELLDSIPHKMPLVITLHEMSFFTGGCHYSSGCRRFEKECGECPLLKNSSPDDLSKKQWRLKFNALQRRNPSNTAIVTDSEWLAEEARKSGLLKGLGFPIQTIHYGIDPELFYPRDKTVAKENLGLPLDCPIILFASENLFDRRKGFDLLSEAISQLPKPLQGQFISFGRISDHSSRTTPIRHFGFIENDHLMALLYNAADLFVIPSREEAFGLTSLEAMACGTPVLGFRRGGIPEMIDHHQTGALSDDLSAHGLKDALIHFFDHRSLYNNYGAKAREKVLTTFTQKRNAEDYLALYQKLRKGIST